MSHVSLLLAGLGAISAAVGSGVLLARFFRAPRADLLAWSVALLGLLISLGAQALGYEAGFDAAMFRAMEIGGQVIAPLATVLGLSEVAGKSLAARFCARVYIPSLAIVAVVVLTLDQLAAVAFTKSWPNPQVYYQLPPDYMLMYAVAPLTALVAAIAICVVLYRSGKPGWIAVLPSQLMAGAAAFLLAYPPLAQLVTSKLHKHLPVGSVFTFVCFAAAVLVLLAGVRLGRIDIAALRGGSGSGSRQGAWDTDTGAYDSRGDFGGRDGYGRRDGYARQDDYGRDDYGRDDYGRDNHGRDGARRSGGYPIDQTGDFERFDGEGQGVYRDGGLYRPDPQRRQPAQSLDDNSYTYDREDRRAGYDDWRLDGSAAGHGPGDFQTGDLDLGQQDAEFGPGGYASRHSDSWQDAPGRRQDGYDELDRHDRRDDYDRPDGYGRPDGRGDGRRPSRADLFGQIAIYTLLEDRIAEFDQLTERVVTDVRGHEPDTLVFIVHAVPSAPMQRILYEVYRSRDAYEWHRQQRYVTQFEADRRPYVLATNVIELGLQQAKVSPFPSVADLFGEPGYDTSGFERPDYLRDYGKPSAGKGESRGSGRW
ncbi:MAG TPA: antibiotic biosynthesis monooxygenase [Streptosporangiaceae bacterium]|nr:antibiotic biosynthesis monooxygenase [Streptosporangiaceae bacterium]